MYQTEIAFFRKKAGVRKRTVCNGGWRGTSPNKALCREENEPAGQRNVISNLRNRYGKGV